MFTAYVLASAVAGLLLSSPALAASPVHKCVVNGAVTYQRDPCPAGQVRPLPTTEQLNAERRKQTDASAMSAASQPSAPVRTTPAPGPVSPNSGTPDRPTLAPVEPPARYRCDGRTYCSQMTSCAEAKYFLANCPGVKMDGDRNGIPCEKQWCNR
jgi:hypothetical protein